VTGILHLCNQEFIIWFSKRQATVETAILGSEFTTARMALDQIIDVRTTFGYIRVPVNTTLFMLGDNQAVVTNTSIHHSSLINQHNARAYHSVYEINSALIMGYY
jgi:hypothetical protein